MKKRKVMAFVLAASAGSGLILAHDTTANADDINNKDENGKVIESKAIAKTATIVNVSSNLRIRSGASTNTSIVGYIKNGETVEVKGTQGDWYKIKYKSTEGYVHKDYVKLGNSGSNTGNSNSGEQAVNKKGKVINVTSSLRVRSGAGTNHSVKGYINNGEEFDILAKSGDWYKIKNSKVNGYVHKDYVKELGNNSNNNNNNNNTGNSNSGEQAVNKKGKVINVTSSLRVRSGAGTNHSVKGYINNGEEFDILAKSGDWYKIKNSKVNGYVHKDYVKELGNNSNNNNNNSNTGNSNSGEQAVNKKGKVINVTSSLRVRSGAGTNHSIKGYINNGEEFDILAKSGDWYKIKNSKVDGYVHKDYVKELGNNSNNNNSDDNTNNNGQTLSKRGKVINVTSSLRVRSGAGTNHSVQGYINNGEEFDIIGKSGEWYNIKTDGITGYVHGDYVKELGSNSNDNNNNNNNSNTESSKTIGQVVNVTSNLRIRNSNSTSSSVVGYLLNGEKFEILGKSGDWYKIKKESVVGYILGDYVKVISGNISNDNNSNENNNSNPEYKNQYGIVVNVTSSLRYRTAPNTNAQVLGYLLPGEKIKVLSKENDWYKIDVNGKTGYAHSDYIRLTDSTDVIPANFQNVYDVLKPHIGSPYIWGGKGELITTSSMQKFKNMYPSVAAEGKYDIPSKFINSGYRAFDCSGLLYWGFNQIGMNIGPSTYSQINAGREVSVNDARPGDLLFYGDLSHVGMYVGDGKWIEAPKSHDYVKVANVPWSRISRVRRVLN